MKPKTQKTDKSLDFLKKKKEEMKNSKFRKTYDSILEEYNNNLVNTVVQKNTIDMSEPKTIMVAGKRPDGTNDFFAMPRVMNTKGSGSDTPRAEMPIAYSKIMVATSAIASNVPDGHTYSTNKIKARTYYELWKRTWTTAEMNGLNTLEYAVMQMFGTGTGAWRVFPRKVSVEKTNKKGIKAPKILYDDIYREPLDMNRTWLGLSYKAYSDDGRPEVLYEIDITNEEYLKLKKRLKKSKTNVKKDAVIDAGISSEAQNADSGKSETHVTISFYECPKTNRYMVASDTECLYDGEMPNEECYGGVVLIHCFVKNFLSNYGVGLWELIRGNQAIQNYIESLNTEQVASEIIPMIFFSGNIQGDMTISRSTTKPNILPAGTKVEKFLTTGNSTLGMNYISRKKQENDEITGVNDIIAGGSVEDTLGSTVIRKEAALNRLMRPRNSVSRGLEKDACIYFSWLEQDQSYSRDFSFATEGEAEYFKTLNPMYDVNQEMLEKEDGSMSYEISASEFVPLNFDISIDDLEENDYQDAPIQEVGGYSYLKSKSKILGDISDLSSPDKMGYDKVILVIDPNSMLVPSSEFQKQNAMQLYPIVSNSLMQIYGMARQDPEQAKAQLKSFAKMLISQKENVYDYIPKEDYDKIMGGGMATPPPEIMAQIGPDGQSLAADNTPIGQPQDPNEMPRPNSPLEQSFNGSIVRQSKA